jgi:SAM-dependent methyltransferase
MPTSDADSDLLSMVACVGRAAPYSESAASLVRAAARLPATPYCHSLRIACCYDLFHSTEAILGADSDPVPPFARQLDEHARILEAAIPRRTPHTEVPSEEHFVSLEQETGSHYGRLFEEFDPEHYYGEASKLLRTRFERNGFDLSFCRGRTALDAGCGGGRYTVALKRLGFDAVTGVDFSEDGLASARERLAKSGDDGIRFVQSNVLSLPFDDASFDFVFSNGVLHHTRDPERGFQELLRVLRPGGRGFAYVIEEPGGIHWDVIEVLRAVMRGVPYWMARRQFALMGVPPNRRFYILDHIMVPINIRSTPEQVEALLGNAGARNVRRLTRGADFDRIERIHQDTPFAAAKYGVGENRYIFEK